MKPLSDQEAWGLFMKKLDPANKLNPEVEQVAMEMAKKCDGLPLAIAVVARSMKGVDNILRWKNELADLEHKMRHNDMKNEVLPVLLYSYNRLNENLRQCFLYCSLYPEDYAILRYELVTNFISEGLTSERDTWSRKLDLGHTLLDELVNACFLESEGKEYVRMHNLLREMAVEITRNNPKFMAKAGLELKKFPDEQQWNEDLDKVSLMNNILSEIPEGLSPNCPRLSTLILSQNPLELIPDSFFVNMKGLRVLDLSWTKIEELPSSISELEKLTALLLGNCDSLCYVPPLNKLTELRELDMRRSLMKELPAGLECLVKLQCLNMSEMHQLEEIPSGLLSRLSGIQRLKLPFHLTVDVEEVESLKLLEEFEGTITDMFNFKWFNKYPQLTKYNVLVGQLETDKDDFEGDKFLLLDFDNAIIFNHYSNGGPKELLLPQNMKVLGIIDCKIFEACLLDTFPSLYYSKDLTICLIEDCDELESIMRISDHEFPKSLEKLTLNRLLNLMWLIKIEPGVVALPSSGIFSTLKKLYIEECPKIKKLFAQKSLIQDLKNLESLKVIRCHQMEEIIGDEEEDSGVSSASDNSNNPIIAFPKLRKLLLCDLPELKSIYKGTINCCDAIESIEITWCRDLERLPFFHDSGDEKPPTASSMSSSSSPPSSSYYKNNARSTCIFPKLQKLELRELKRLKSICHGNMACDSIWFIRIWECTQLSRLPLSIPLKDGQPSAPPSLKHIQIRQAEREWWESLEWDNPKSKNVLEPFVRYVDR